MVPATGGTPISGFCSASGRAAAMATRTSSGISTTVASSSRSHRSVDTTTTSSGIVE